MKFQTSKLCLLFLLFPSLLILHSCGLVEEPTTTVSCSGVCSSQTKQTGVFVDSAVAGVTFRTTSGFSGTTNSKGEFNFVAGDTASFSIGDVDLGSVAASSVLTPVEVMGASDTADQRVINLARLLQTLDSDGDPTNGINISSGTSNALKGKSVNFNVSVDSFDNDSTIAQVLSIVGRSLKSATDALNHLQSTMNNRGLSGKVANDDKLKELVPDYAPTNSAPDTTAVLHNNLYWQRDYAMGQYSNDYCGKLTIDNRTWRVPVKSELQALCYNPNPEIDVSRGNDNGTLMTFNPIQTNYGRLCLCMEYVGGNCVDPQTYCNAVLGCGNDDDYAGWATKCVSDP